MSTYWRHVTSVFTGSLIAQSIPIIGSLAITRIFAPSEFGEFSTWLAIVSVAAVVVTMRLETVLAIVEDGKARVQAVSIVLVTTFIVVIAFSLVLYLLSYFTIVRSYLPDQPILPMLFVPAALFVALNQVWQTWAAVEGAYGKLNIMRLVQALTIVVVQISAGLICPESISLVLGFLLASFISFLTALILMPQLICVTVLNRDTFLAFFCRYKKFPLYALPADSISTAVAQLPVLVVYHRFGSEAAGYLALTIRVLGAPVGLVGKAILDVFKRYAVKDIREIGNCRDIYMKTFKVLALSSVFMVICTTFLAEDIFRIAFGVEWIASGETAIWLLPMFALGLIASPLSYIVYLVERQYLDLLWQAALMVVVVAALYMCSTLKATLIGYAIGYAVMYVFYLGLSFRLSGGRW